MRAIKESLKVQLCTLYSILGLGQVTQDDRHYSGQDPLLKTLWARNLRVGRGGKPMLWGALLCRGYLNGYPQWERKNISFLVYKKVNQEDIMEEPEKGRRVPRKWRKRYIKLRLSTQRKSKRGKLLQERT